jgi:predicted dehydrogenase
MSGSPARNVFVPPSRRDVLGIAATGAALYASGAFAHARGSDTLRVGLVGCGGRGSGAVADCLRAAPGTEVVALGDAFADRLEACRTGLEAFAERNRVVPERCFVGFDAYQRVIASDVDLVILATPPGFRPQHLRAAVEAGKHVFMEKPVAVDPAGIRSVLASAEIARERGLAIVAGTQRRHDGAYQETIRRIHEGALGEIVAAQCYWNQGGLWMHPRQAAWSDLEWQMRNWLYFTWLSGDHIVEQHVHNLDVINWALGAHPVRCTGMGGRQVRIDPAYGNVFDHFAVEYEYPGGARVHSFSRQIDNCATRVAERIVGTRGTSDACGSIRGETNWRFEGEAVNPYQQEHADLIASIRAGAPLNEARQVAESTLTAIMGRMSAYTGKDLTWEQALESKLDLVPQALAFGPMEVAPVALPGRSEAI